MLNEIPLFFNQDHIFTDRLYKINTDALFKRYFKKNKAQFTLEHVYTASAHNY